MRTKPKTLLWVLLLAIVMSATSCSLTKSKAIADRAVSQFHNQFNAEKYHEIYSQADEGFRKNSTEAEVIALFEAVHKKLGVVKTATSTSWRANATPGGTTVVIDYDTDFAEGKAVEHFAFQLQGEKALLYGYNISSNLLITK